MAHSEALRPAADRHLNVTPLIDIMLCLVIFYLLCAVLNSGCGGRGDGWRMPASSQGREDLRERRSVLYVNVTPDREGQARFVVRGEEVPQGQLAQALTARVREAPQLEVRLRATRDLPYEAISPVLQSCAQANIRRVHLAVEEL